MYRFGIHLGIAFQLQDDYLDAFGDADFGKQKGGDIIENKKTWLYLKALQLANQEDKEQLIEIFRSKEMANEDSVQGGIIKSSLNIKGQGKTVNAILGSASGDFDFFVDEAVYHTPEVDKAQSFLDVLRGEGDSKDKLNVSCMVGQFDIASGVAKSKMLAFKTAGAVTSGDGTIKLNDSTMDIVLKARSGLVGLADVVPPLRMTGPISNPSVSVDPAGSLIGLGKLFLGATTGVGLVAVLGEQATDKLGITSDSNPCLKSMAEMEAKENEAKQNPKEAYKKIEDNVREKRDEIKEDVKHDLKKLESNAKQIRDGLKSLLKKK